MLANTLTHYVSVNEWYIHNTGEELDVYEPVRKKPRFDIDRDSAIMLSTTLSEVIVFSTTYTCLNFAVVATHVFSCTIGSS